MAKRSRRTRVPQRKTANVVSSLGRSARTLPALARAQRVTAQAARVGFDWPAAGPVWNKVEEELGELKAAAASGQATRVKAEMGDLLLSLVNLSRFLNVRAEASLAESVDRFLNRFAYIEKKFRETGKSLQGASLAEMDRLWDEAKKLERGTTR